MPQVTRYVAPNTTSAIHASGRLWTHSLMSRHPMILAQSPQYRSTDVKMADRSRRARSSYDGVVRPTWTREQTRVRADPQIVRQHDKGAWGAPWILPGFSSLLGTLPADPTRVDSITHAGSARVRCDFDLGVRAVLAEDLVVRVAFGVRRGRGDAGLAISLDEDLNAAVRTGQHS